MLRIEERIKIAIENNNFTITKRNTKFHRTIAKYFNDITGWFEGCDVHHLDENPCNNHPSNLLCCSRSEHLKFHKNRLGIPNSDETRKKLSIALKGKLKGRQSPMKGKIKSGK